MFLGAVVAERFLNVSLQQVMKYVSMPTQVNVKSSLKGKKRRARSKCRDLIVMEHIYFKGFKRLNVSKSVV